jgi:GNAT superfamily N-acetyltransferase
MSTIEITDVTPDNIDQTGIFCIKDHRAEGTQNKKEWFLKQYDSGLRIKIAFTESKQAGFIEYMPAEIAWRPVNAVNYLFIQCIGIFIKDARKKNLGTTLIRACEQDARQQNKAGICTMTSSGAWMANQSVFEKNGFIEIERLDRYELMVKNFDERNPLPKFINWKNNQAQYTGWNLVFANQCPWHTKSAQDLREAAAKRGIELKVTLLKNSSEAKQAPSGFGVFSLIRDGRLIEDHYLSRKRFENILDKELKPKKK